ncbi:MAG: bifunctional ornithine acetyltransferase/N-acetylglutamate synthase [Clostridiales bacterium]|jgi:glutamate N-acetyltransferase/amino-acid N-acetyltransferase|nr:bifunctional ornithine acetyltransferase/N-acetylglutamate synthase [Clostridiales bacterium]
MKIIEGGVIAPIGFKATGGHVGAKKQKKDLCLLISDTPAVFAGCFTRNIVKAAPVLWDMKIAANGGAVKGIVANSGNANACTGEKGVTDTADMAKTFADCLNAQPEEILVCSTGVIGVPMPMDVIEKGIRALAPTLGSAPENGTNAAEAIMTTDTFMKTAAVEITLSGKTVRIGGMAKGSGMIHPNMGTMLSFITTDAAVSRQMLEKALKDSTQNTSNMISVDNDTSTNDTLLVLANGLAGNPPIENETADYAAFKEALDYVNKKLATDIAKDGEGATKLIEATVTGAKTNADARKIVKSVVSSSLFKAAMFGADANWGRAICAMGYSGADFNPNAVTIAFTVTSEGESITVIENGAPLAFDEDRAKKILSHDKINVDIRLNEGEETATAWGCDLTYDYVKINGDYRS